MEACNLIRDSPPLSLICPSKTKKKTDYPARNSSHFYSSYHGPVGNYQDETNALERVQRESRPPCLGRQAASKPGCPSCGVPAAESRVPRRSYASAARGVLVLWCVSAAARAGWAGQQMGISAGSTPKARPPRQQQQQPPRGGGADGEASTPVFLNVYDVTPANGYARWLGLGVYHSGVQVHAVEYAYGAHDGASSGIFEVVPRRCPGYTFRESVLVGTTDLTRAEVRALMAELAVDFPGDAYNLVSRNCNHFCDVACRRLVRARIPRWVNRLAKIGVVFTCVIPGNGRAVRPGTGKQAGGIRSRSARHEGSAPPRTRAFFRSLSVGGRKNPTARQLSASPPRPPPAPAPSASTSSGSTT